VETEEGDYVSAPVLFEEALALYREVDDKHGIGDALMQIGWAAMRTGDYDQVATRLEESLTRFQEVNNARSVAFALAGLGELALRRKQYERATHLLEESLVLRREQGDKWGIGTSLGSLGWVALCQRDFKRMRELMRDSLLVRMATGDRGGIAWCLEKLAEAAVLQTQAAPPAVRPENLRRAARIFGAAAALRAPLNSVIDPVDQPDYERNVADLRRLLGEEAFAAAWAAGGAMELQQAVDEALAEPETPPVFESLSPSQTAKEKFGGLTEREREVAALVAQGKSNREIAAVLVVGVKTVETYVTRILNKLGFDSRVQIATWAKDKDLA
jgi:non-specific serine/threonine protein kinase